VSRSSERGDGTRGFTLLEVLIAVFVVAIVLGTLVTFVSQNLHRLGDARRELIAAGLARERAQSITQAGEQGELPQIGTREGRFPEPDDDLLWTESVEGVWLPLPEGWTGPPPPSPLFASTNTRSRVPTLYRVEVRAFPEELEPESIDPVVVCVVAPVDVAEVP
jgi:prepilin-type N-terminal cleavage/methylation domain-containing protein